MKIHEFTTHFPDERSCRLHFKKVREEKGVVCKKCNCNQHYWLKSKWQWQCKHCDFRTTLRSGTAIQFSNLPFYKWYLCMALMSGTKKGISAKEMQRQLGHSRYRTVWLLMQKVRAGMGEMDCPLNLDEANRKEFKHSELENQKSNGIASGLKYAFMEANPSFVETNRILTLKCSNIHVSAQISWIGERKALRPGFSKYFNSFLSFSDYRNNEKLGLAWMKIIHSNAKRSILGIYHKISTHYLQNYLSEFCFRLNRRQLDDKRFDSLLFAIAQKYCGTIATIHVF